jgi:cytochrome c biogenesis protein CcmG/thiol:disulfide interchange protein DsbE
VLLVAGVAAAVAVVTMLLAFGLRQDPSRVRSPLVGRQAPSFTLSSLRGDRAIRLASLRGRVVVLNFWSSTCAECRVEDPALRTAWLRFHGRGVVMLGISFEDPPDAARAYASELGLDWPLAEDPGSRTALAYGVSGVPETFFIGRNGRIAAKQIGPVSYPLLVWRLSSLLASAGRSQ